MIRIATLFIAILVFSTCDENDNMQNELPLYFPPLSSSTWESLDPDQLGWNRDAIPDLLNFLEDNNSRAFLLIKDGKIVVEAYMGKQFDRTTDFNASSNWYWASAGKTLTAALIGIAEARNEIDLDARTSTYLGVGWTSLPRSLEDKITVRHQLNMTTGLDDGNANPDCTSPQCLTFRADPGTRWAYHNAPYTLLDGVIANATNQTLNAFLANEIKSKIGMDGQYVQTGDNNVFYSTARSMARFGLLLLNKGKWDQTQILSQDFHQQMIASSQDINPSYGYLTWLNGKGSIMAPKDQRVFPRSLTPDAPADMYAAMGKNGQLINVVPSQNLVIVRMGDVPDNSLVPFTFQEELWVKLNAVIKN